MNIPVSRSRGGIAAAALAATGTLAIWNAYRARRAERDHPPGGQFTEVDGVRLHYIDRGRGRPIVLLHGNGTMIEELEISGLVDSLSAGYRIVAFDRPGFGHTARPRGLWTAARQATLLQKALDTLGIEKPLVVGHSWGTIVALEMALAPGAALAGLVLISGYYFPSLRADIPLAAAPAIPVTGDIMRYTVSPVIGRMIASKIYRKLFAPAPVTPEFKARFPTALALRPSQIRANAQDSGTMIPAAAALAPRYAALTVPVTIIAGDGDQIVDPTAQSARLHATLPGSDLILIPGAGHMVHHTEAGRVCQAIEHAAAAVWPQSLPLSKAG